MASKMMVMAAALRQLNRSTCLWSARYGRVGGDFLLHEELFILDCKSVFGKKSCKYREGKSLVKNIYATPGTGTSRLATKLKVLFCCGFILLIY
jgi:hypothetical protein